MRVDASHPPHLVDEAGPLVLRLFRGRLLVVASLLPRRLILRATVIAKTLSARSRGCCILFRGGLCAPTLVASHGRFLLASSVAAGMPARSSWAKRPMWWLVPASLFMSSAAGIAEAA